MDRGMGCGSKILSQVKMPLKVPPCLAYLEREVRGSSDGGFGAHSSSVTRPPRPPPSPALAQDCINIPLKPVTTAARLPPHHHPTPHPRLLDASSVPLFRLNASLSGRFCQQMQQAGSVLLPAVRMPSVRACVHADM